MEALTREERIGYLANVLRVAHSDGDLAASERQVFDDVAVRLEAGASELAEARQHVLSGETEFRRCGSAVAQRATFDDMLLMSMADGSFDKQEQVLLEGFAATIGLSQADVNMALRRAANRLAELRKRMPSAMASPSAARPAGRTAEAPHAPEPSAPTPPPHPPARSAGRTVARHAPEPAAMAPRPSKKRERFADSEPAIVRKAPRTILSEMMRGPWEARVEPSTATMTPTATVETAAPTAAEGSPYADPPYAVIVPADPPSAATPTSPAPEQAPTSSHAETPLDRCLRARSQAGEPEAYCYGIGTSEANPWGCRLACMPLAAGADWLGYGTFRDRHSFVFDRERITESLEQRLATASSCPHLCLTQVMRTLAAFPARAMPGPLWAWRASASDEPGTSMPWRRYVHGCAVNSLHRVAAPDPVGDALLRRLLRDTRAPVELKR